MTDIELKKRIIELVDERNATGVAIERAISGRLPLTDHPLAERFRMIAGLSAARNALEVQVDNLEQQRDELLRDMQDVLDMLINQPHAVTAANHAEDMLRLSIGTAKYFAKGGAKNHLPDTEKMVVPKGLPLVTDSCSALMTLEEAIAHADEKAIGNSQCAAQHAQLAKWLTDYRAMLAAAPKHEGGAS